MHAKPLPVLIAVLVLLITGGALWYILTHPASEGPSGTSISTPSGTEVGERVHIRDVGPYHDIDATYPSATTLKTSAGASADAAAVSLMKSFAEQEAARFEDSTVSEITAEDVEFLQLGGERRYVLEADYDIHESEKTVSYVYHMFADTLGAHPNAYYRTFTFDKSSGEALHLDEIFSTSDYLDVLSNESRTRLAKTIAAASNIPLADFDRTMLDAGTTPFPDNFGNFYLEGEVFVIIFPPYQVGPWAIGTQEARIPRSELGNTLQERYR